MRTYAITLLAITLLAGGIAAQESEAKRFPNPAGAVEAMAKACETNDVAALTALVGAKNKDVLGDPDDGGLEERRREFAESIRGGHKLEPDGADRMTLLVGSDDWPFPVPLVRDGKGWFWDASAGREELLNRLIGENEYEAIAICRGYVDAQMEYASSDRDDDEVLEYAQLIRSTAGRRDGLYWKVDPATGERPSPLGELVAEPNRKEGKPYWGYYFRILKKQGGNVPGGKYDYVINGNMIAGFALVAYPAEYRRSGVMTFVVSHQGKVFEKDLGEKTAELAQAMKEYNPDKSWNLVEDEPYDD
jgi:hypothetical protein